MGHIRVRTLLVSHNAMLSYVGQKRKAGPINHRPHHRPANGESTFQDGSIVSAVSIGIARKRREQIAAIWPLQKQPGEPGNGHTFRRWPSTSTCPASWTLRLFPECPSLLILVRSVFPCALTISFIYLFRNTTGSFQSKHGRSEVNRTLFLENIKNIVVTKRHISRSGNFQRCNEGFDVSAINDAFFCNLFRAALSPRKKETLFVSLQARCSLIILPLLRWSIVCDVGFLHKEAD